jgi:trk system potassium uptake protein TrkA
MVTSVRPVGGIGGLNRVAIGGCGRMGAAIAHALSTPGRVIHILDILPDAFDHLPMENVNQGTVVPFLADITLESDLRATGVQDADVFIATAGSDAVNAMASQIARHILGVGNVICRLNDPVKREMYESLELTTISPTEILRDLTIQHL